MRWDLLIGGLGKPGAAKRGTSNGSPPSGAGTAPPSAPTSPEMAAAVTMTQLDQMMKENAHVLAMGKAQLRKHLGADWEEPDDVSITWNSPTTTNYGSRGGALGKLAMGAALLAGGVGLGSALPWLSGKVAAPPAAAAAGEDTDTRYSLGLGDPDESPP